MRSFGLIFLYVFLIHFANGQVSGNIQLTNNGVAPVPIFALGRPAILSTTYIRKGNFYFNPEFNLGLDAKPWTIFSRIGYYFVENKKLNLAVATNLNWFFMQRNPAHFNNEEFQVQRYNTWELDGDYQIKENQKLYFQYWRTEKLDQLGIWYENFINLAYSFDRIKLGNEHIFSIRPSVFYLDDYGWLQGFFAAQTITYQLKKWKCNVFYTCSTPLTPHMQGTEFIWNTGINFPF